MDFLTGKQIPSTLTSLSGAQHAFYKFYAELFQEEADKKLEIEEFLQKCDIDKVPVDFVRLLDDPITEEEVIKVIDIAKLGKAIGPDGFSARYYKTFKEQLTPV